MSDRIHYTWCHVLLNQAIGIQQVYLANTRGKEAILYFCR